MYNVTLTDDDLDNIQTYTINMYKYFYNINLNIKEHARAGHFAFPRLCFPAKKLPKDENRS